ncbi:MAG TPA: bifunctional ornithine acetyltransferase/N-acetylglutamate synthase [Anaeromyxobacteraceae bacterium]|nr:bifunctional ornithine acetyltransferase/N-acetylglutamate synthase [Anaeromyxobacteraceae bacterium]
MSSTSLVFASPAEHRAHIEKESRLPAGFRTGTTSFEFTPIEVPKPARMRLTLIALDRPTPAFALKATRNAFVGAPVLLARQRLAAPRLGALVVNNKIANVCAPGGLAAAEAVCAEVARALSLGREEVLPASTGVIGWRLPVAAMREAVPRAVAALQDHSILPAAEAIMTTDLYPKVRRAEVGSGVVLGIAKGAGMIEPNLATMLVFLLTDLDVSREELREALDEAVERSFQAISVDSDTSTSDLVTLLSSRVHPAPSRSVFREVLARVCRDLAEDIVRNGEGVHHVIRVGVKGAPDRATARGVGKAIVNSPLFQCAVNGNDPNVGRLLCAVGKYLGGQGIELDTARVRMRMGGELLLESGHMQLDPEKEARLVDHLRRAELYASRPPQDGLTFRPPIAHPPHERTVEVEVDLGAGTFEEEVLGADRSHEYITENADYRS